MSFRGRGGRGGRGSSRGGRGGGRGGGRSFDQGPPATVKELGAFMHDCEGDMVCMSTQDMIPYFNAPIYLENKTQIGKVDEIFGAINSVHFSVKCSDGVVSSSFKGEQKVYINPEKLLPLSRFLPKPAVKKTAGGVKKAGRGGARGRGGMMGRGGRGGRGMGGGRGGRGMGRGMSRGMSRGGSRGGRGRGGSR